MHSWPINQAVGQADGLSIPTVASMESLDASGSCWSWDDQSGCVVEDQFFARQANEGQMVKNWPEILGCFGDFFVLDGNYELLVLGIFVI